MSSRITLDYFQLNRPEQYEAARQIVAKMFYFDESGKVSPNRRIKNQYVALWAALKWGKREVLDMLPMFCEGVEFIYLSPPHKSLQTQREELFRYGWKIDAKGKKIIEHYHPRKVYVIAFDEADWGDGTKQNFEKRFKQIEEKTNVILLGISATNFTFVHNLEKFFNNNCVIGKKGPQYCGLEKFPRTTVNEKPFDKDGSFTSSFEKIIREWLIATKTSPKLKFIVRDTKFSAALSEERVKEQLENLCQEMCGNKRINLIVVDQDHDYKWKRNNDDAWISAGKEMFIVKQTFTRGTETDIQKFLYGYYEYRTKNTALNTIAQALGRFPNYGGIDDIKLFISEISSKYIDIYLEIENEIYDGNTLSSVFEESKNKEIALSGKLRKTISNNNSHEWNYDFSNKIVAPILPDEYKPRKDFPKNNIRKASKLSTRNIVIKAISGRYAPDGRWNNSHKDGKSQLKAGIVFYPDIFQSNTPLSNIEISFLQSKGIYSDLLQGNYVVIPANLVGTTSRNNLIKDSSCYPAIVTENK